MPWVGRPSAGAPLAARPLPPPACRPVHPRLGLPCVLPLAQTKQYKKGIKNADAILKKFPDHGETLAMKVGGEAGQQLLRVSTARLACSWGANPLAAGSCRRRRAAGRHPPRHAA